MYKLTTLLALGAMLAGSAAVATAQVEQTVEVHGQAAGAFHFEFGGADDATPVKGIPLSADIVNTHVQHLADGNKITNEETSHFYRDSEGRTRRENKIVFPGQSGENAATMIMINDPVAHTRFILNTEHKSADQLPNHEAGSTNAVFVSKRIAEQKVSGTKPSDEQKEDLGTQTIEGVVAHGTRATHVIPAGQMGNERPITVTTESWYSDELGMEVLRIHSDPWSGEVTTKVTNVRRGEPEASLFTPPADYKMQKIGPDRRVIHLETKDGQPLPPPPPEE